MVAYNCSIMLSDVAVVDCLIILDCSHNIKWIQSHYKYAQKCETPVNPQKQNSGFYTLLPNVFIEMFSLNHNYLINIWYANIFRPEDERTSRNGNMEWKVQFFPDKNSGKV